MRLQEGYIHLDAVSIAAFTCNDLPWEIAYEKVLSFAHHSSASFMDPVTQVAYTGDVPVSYLVCEKDFVVSTGKQREFIKVLEESGKSISVRSLECGHCPNWSMPKELAEVVVEEVEKGV